MFKTAPEEAENQVSDTDENLGDFLKNARLSQGLNLASIADETRINCKSLIALEENSRTGLPADVFSRGFVKIYAAYLKLDPQEAIRLYEKQWGAPGTFADPFTPPKPSIDLAPGIILTLVLVALFFAIRIYYPGPQEDTAPATMDSPVAGKNEISPVPLPAAPAANPSPAATNGGEPVAEPNRPPMDEPEATPTDTSNQPQAEEPVITPPYEIKLQFTERTKIKLSLDGRKAIEKTFPTGSSQTWQAKKEFDLTLDQTNGVTLTINGAPVAIKAEAGQPVTIHRP